MERRSKCVTGDGGRGDFLRANPLTDAVNEANDMTEAGVRVDAIRSRKHGAVTKDAWPNDTR
jgi:hypothetical protein